MASADRRVALVTGASQGIGRAIALRLAADGFLMAVNDLSRCKDSLDSLSHDLAEKYDRKVVSVVGDVSEESDVEAMIACVVEDLGKLDVMIANAGVVLFKPILQTTVEDWDKLDAVNIRGTFLCYKYAAQQMITQGTGGRIVGACSAVGKQGEPNMAAYSATKFAIRGLTQAAAHEFGIHGITVNAYAPGAIDTPLLQNLSGNKTGFYEQEARKTALGHIGTPGDVASVVAYLVSEEACYITGQSISVNGGRFFD